VKKINVIGVASVFRISLVLSAIAGFLIGVVLMIQDFMDHMMLEGVVTVVLAPILYGILGACVNAFMAWVYNAVSARIGGIEIEIGD
jgi:hypothetical protein